MVNMDKLVVTFQITDNQKSICYYGYQISCGRLVTLISLVWISPSEATSWCVKTYLSHFDRAFSLGSDTLMARGMMGCKTVPKSILLKGVWSTHFSLAVERVWRCSGCTGVTVYRTGTQLKKKEKIISKQNCGSGLDTILTTIS